MLLTWPGRLSADDPDLLFNKLQLRRLEVVGSGFSIMSTVNAFMY